MAIPSLPTILNQSSLVCNECLQLLQSIIYGYSPFDLSTASCLRLGLHVLRPNAGVATWDVIPVMSV